MRSKAIRKIYGDRTVLDVPAFDFEPGKIYAVMGANGSGKSTFAKAIALDGACENGISVGYMPQKNYAFRMSVRKNALAASPDEKKTDVLLERMGLTELAGKNAKTLSGGETAKLALVRILAKRFDLLILDEPTAAMDVEGTLEAERLIREYCDSEKAAVILITHSVNQAGRIGDRIMVLCGGKLAEEGDASSVIKEPSSAAAKALFMM